VARHVPIITRSPWRLLTLLLALAACSTPPAPLTHDAYIWQRAWRPAVAEAMRGSADMLRQWRVLAAEAGPGSRLAPVAVDWQALRQSIRPTIMVVRVDGQLPELDEAALLAAILKLRQDWVAAGVPPAGIEIDHDCGSARLPGYARILGQLRLALKGEVPLSITALPAWLGSVDLDAVLAQVDEAVLQVHAVKNPAVGLFDADMARDWIARFAAHSPVPFRIALPTYGSRVDFDQFGNPVAVESEAPLLASMPNSRELMAQPSAVASLLASLEHNPPRGLRGIAWFRLPTEEDRRTWSAATWRAVVQGRLLVPVLAAHLQAAKDQDLYDLVLENTGDIDAPWPKIEVGAGCTAADAIGGYALKPAAPGHLYYSNRSGLLRSHQRTLVGWLRCSSEKVNLHVAP
jgi:hypothetical protein